MKLQNDSRGMAIFSLSDYMILMFYHCYTCTRGTILILVSRSRVLSNLGLA